MNSPDRFSVAIANEQASHAVDEAQLVEGAIAVLTESEFSSAEISLAIVDDEAMQELNRQYLNHDYPTDVLSFVLDESGGHLQGEVIISADTAAAEASEIGWPAGAEQLLYVIHGVLHLVGYRDKDPQDAAAMRAAEARILSHFGYRQPSQPADGRDS